MNNNTKNSDSLIPEKVLELLPWYAIGKLSVDDQAFFEKALVTHPSLQTLLEQEQTMITKVSVDKSILDKSAIAPTEERLKSVLNMIDLEESQEKSNDLGATSLLGKVKKSFDNLISSSDGTPQYTRVASVGVLVLSVAVLTAFVAPLFTDKNDYVPASATTLTDTSAPSTSNTTLLVGFNGSSSALGSIQVLKDKLTKIVSVPNKEGIFQISFKQTLSNDEIQQTIDALLEQKELVWFAGEKY